MHQAVSAVLPACWLTISSLAVFFSELSIAKVSNSRPIGHLWGSWNLNINSLASGRCINNLESVIFKHMLRIKFMSTCKIALRSLPQNLPNEKSTLVQVMAWCRQATSHYLSQCWPRSLLPYGITRPQWVNTQMRQDFSKSHRPFWMTSHCEWELISNHDSLWNMEENLSTFVVLSRWLIARWQWLDC